MNETINKPYEISLDYYFFDLAEETGNNTIATFNCNKVFKEKLANLALQKFFLNGEVTFESGFNFYDDKKDTDKNYFRRELFPLNYLTVNDFFLSIIIVSELKPDYIYLSRKISESNLVADFIVPVFIDENNKIAHILGYADLDTVKRKIAVHSESSYFMKFHFFQNIDSIFGELSREKSPNLDINENLNDLKFEITEKALETFQKSLDHGNIPEDFIEDINYVSDNLYYSLLYSEELSRKYLQLQNTFYNLKDSKVSEQAKIIDFNERKRKILTSAFLLNSKINHYRSVIKYAAAATQGKNRISVFEFDYENVFKTELETEVFVDNEEHELRIGGLEKYIGCNWFLYIDLSENDLQELGFTKENKGDIFKEWNQEFFDKNRELLQKISFTAGSPDESEIIKENYLDIQLGEYVLPENLNILFAVLVEKL